METVISVVAGELVSRLFSFAINKKYYSSYVCLEEKVERLQHLLIRVHTVVEEADARSIINSGMLMQLKILSEDMYRGYHALDSFRFHHHEQSSRNKVTNSYFPSAAAIKRPRTILGLNNKGNVLNLQVDEALESLETIVVNLSEFVAFLGGCEKMSRRPYDAYLYIGSFMFGRHIEKQKLFSFLLQYNPPSATAVLPIIGCLAVGKKTLVAHVCSDQRVRTHFSSIFHLNGDNFLRFMDKEIPVPGRKLVIVEFVSDVDDNEWKKFHSFVSSIGRGSKVIIISKLERLARFGSVKTNYVNKLSYEEFWYLFKILAFGSADPMEHPRLVPIAEEFAKDLQLEGSLVAANALADVLRSNLNAQLWLCILSRCRRVIERNLCIHGEQPKLRFEQGQEVDITEFALHPSSPIRILPCISSNRTVKELPMMTLGELLMKSAVRPKGEFNLLTWESKLPPYTSFVHFVPHRGQNTPEGTTLSGTKRPRMTL